MPKIQAMPQDRSQLHLISEEYRRLNIELHSRLPTYGTTGRQYVAEVRQLAIQIGARSILDYGCGKRDLWAALHMEFDVREYDPAVPGLESSPEPADLVACIDVLEHVEPDCLNAVLADLARVSRKACFLTIATGPSSKMLADGSNCHRIVQSAEWWVVRLRQYFAVRSKDVVNMPGGIQVVGNPINQS